MAIYYIFTGLLSILPYISQQILQIWQVTTNTNAKWASTHWTASDWISSKYFFIRSSKYMHILSRKYNDEIVMLQTIHKKTSDMQIISRLMQTDPWFWLHSSIHPVKVRKIVQLYVSLSMFLAVLIPWSFLNGHIDLLAVLKPYLVMWPGRFKTLLVRVNDIKVS